MSDMLPVVAPKVHISPNSAIITRQRAESSRPVSFVTEQEVNRMAEAALTMRAGERNELLILVLFQGCLRASEAVSLTPRMKVTVDSKHVLAVLGKGNKPRLVAIPERLSFHLGDYASRMHLSTDDRYFPITRFRALQIVKECGEKAGINRRVYTHLLRHGGALTRLEKTGHPKSLQMHLGHSDIKMTMRYLCTLQEIQSLDVESKVEFDR